MARIRTIKPEFWEDEKLAEFPMPCRLFYIGTWNFADDFGVFRASATVLKSKIFPYDENLRVSEIQKWLDALQKARMIIPISHNGESYYLIRTFKSHQIIDKRYQKSILPQNVLDEAIKKITTCSHSDHVVDTMLEKEKEVEKEKEGNNIVFSHKKTIEQREADFYNSLIPFASEYPKEMLRQFYDYWSEHNKTNKKLRFEMQKTFEASKRLAYWASNDKNFKNGNKQQSTVASRSAQIDAIVDAVCDAKGR